MSQDPASSASAGSTGAHRSGASDQRTWRQNLLSEIGNVFATKSEEASDWASFIFRWLLSWFFLGTVISIKNESDEPLTMYIKTTLSDATGFGDWTWNLYKEGWTVVPRKARLWRTEPNRRGTFVLPFCTCLIVLGTEANFTYFLVHNAAAPGDRFATIWTTRHSFRPRFVTVTQNLEVLTSLQCGQANPSKPPMSRAFKHCTYFSIHVDQNEFPKVLLPFGSRIVIGPSLVVPERPHSTQRRGPFNLGVVAYLVDLLNEVTAFIELFKVKGAFGLTGIAYLYLQISIGNSMKNLLSPLPQGQYGENGFWLGDDFDASLALALQAIPGGLQAVLILIISRPRSGIQLGSVLLGFANLTMVTAAVCSSLSELTMNLLSRYNWNKKTKFLAIFVPIMLFLGAPLCTLIGYYYYEANQSNNFILYLVASLIFILLHCTQIANPHQMDAALKDITPIAILRFIKKGLEKLAKFVCKYSVESVIVFLMILMVLANAIAIFVIKEKTV